MPIPTRPYRSQRLPWLGNGRSAGDDNGKPDRIANANGEFVGNQTEMAGPEHLTDGASLLNDEIPYVQKAPYVMKVGVGGFYPDAELA